MVRQLKIVLGDDLRAKLDEVTAASGNSIAEEIRSRVERTFSAEKAAIDAKTQDLLDYIVRLASQVELETGSPWHEHSGVNQVFGSALMVRARRLGPGGEPTAFEIRVEPLKGTTVASTT